MNPRLRAYVEHRFAGAVTDADGRPIAGPNVPWAGRRHGRRKDWRWGVAWSPEQISHRLRIDFPDDESMRISPETIYQSLYVHGRRCKKAFEQAPVSARTSTWPRSCSGSCATAASSVVRWSALFHGEAFPGRRSIANGSPVPCSP